MILVWILVQPFEDGKPILSSQATQNVAKSWILVVVKSLRTSLIEKS